MHWKLELELHWNMELGHCSLESGAREPAFPSVLRGKMSKRGRTIMIMSDDSVVCGGWGGREGLYPTLFPHTSGLPPDV